MLNNLYTQVDFLNLTRGDIIAIKSLLQLEIPEEVDDYEFLFENISNIESNPETNKIISNKLLAGQVAVKWYKFDYNDTFKKDALREKLESSTLGFNVDAKERLSINIMDDIVSIVKTDNVYTIKIFILDGYKRYNNGIESKREMIMKSIVVKIDIEGCWVEIRANEERSKKIVRILEIKLGLGILNGVRILNRYSNDVNKFKDNLIDGFYLNYKAAPSQIIELTEQDGIAIASIINIIDEYFNNKSGETLLDRLQEVDYDTEGISLSTILLAGVDNFGMKIRNDSERDMSNQSLYTILKDHLIEDSSYIRFSTITSGTKYTMQVGLKSNSIVFKSSVTEDVISYIREKVL